MMLGRVPQKMTDSKIMTDNRVSSFCSPLSPDHKMGNYIPNLSSRHLLLAQLSNNTSSSFPSRHPTHPATFLSFKTAESTAPWSHFSCPQSNRWIFSLPWGLALNSALSSQHLALSTQHCNRHSIALSATGHELLEWSHCVLFIFLSPASVAPGIQCFQ